MTILERIPRIDRAVLGYTIMAIGVCLGLFFSFQNQGKIKDERRDRSIQVNRYFRQQCKHDGDRDKILIGTLQDAVVRIQLSNSDPREKNATIYSLNRRINELRGLQAKCLAQIPPVVPK